MIPESLGVRPVWAEVDLDCLAHNMRETRRVTPKETLIMVAVKADGYGHGAPEAAEVFLENGADRLCTATLDEAVQLRRLGFTAPILCLGYVPEYLYGVALEYGVGVTVYRLDHARALREAATGMGVEAVAHVKLDTGMGRLGFRISEATVDEVAEVSGLNGVNLEGVFTHFAVADEADKGYTRMQFTRFMDVVDALEARGVEIPLKHVSNSAAIIDFPEYSLDMVRPGIMLYGFYPSPHVDHGRVSLRPAMTLKAKASHVKEVPESAGISYGLTYKTGRRSVIATVPVGYADGYSRRLSNLGWVAVEGARAPIVGRVCMDQCMVDVTDIPGVSVGDVVTLMGDGSGGSPHVEEVAAWMGTITHEVTCGVSRRVPRVYLRGRNVVGVRDYLNPVA
jgi:alanine racemase